MMRRIYKNYRKVLSLAIAASVSSGLYAADSELEKHQQTISTYCFECHNFIDFEGGLALDILDMGNLSRDAEEWEMVITKLRGQYMPPIGQPRPDDATYNELASWMESELDRAAFANPNPGRPGLYRLNRTEYATVIRDILGLDIDIAAYLPPDNTSYGFDNIADILGVSATLLEGYLAAADRVSAVAIGDPEFPPEQVNYRAGIAYSQDSHIDGLPLGTRGGMVIEHYFPLDGIYEINTSFLANTLDAVFGLQFPHQFEVLVNGERVRLISMGGPADYALMLENAAASKETLERRAQVILPLPAGTHTIGVTFVARSDALKVDQLEPFDRDNFDPVYVGGIPSVSNVEIAGPFNGRTPSGMTRSRASIFSCYPAAINEEMRCAEEILGRIAQQAYRRPVMADDLGVLIDFFQYGRESRGSFDAGIQMGLNRILASPEFLFRFEERPEGVAPGENFRVSDLELASRLSFFLWSSVPDDELIELAVQNRLSDPAVLEAQVFRMLADTRSRALVDNFAGQWLQLRNLSSRDPDIVAFPDFDENLRRAFLQETNLFFESIMRDDRNIVDLLTADYTFLNERLARHYGISGVYGDRFRRVQMDDPARGGLLGHGSILTVTSFPHRTSPVVRGKWVLDNILGAEPADPPDNVPALDENSADAIDVRTMRDRLAQHRADPACSSCHDVMDPIGLAMEMYDGIGRWRLLDEGGMPIDSSGMLANGLAVNDPIELKWALVEQEALFVQTFVHKLLTYAIGRGLEYYDKPTVREIVARARDDDYRFSTIVQEVVRSMPFQMKQAAQEEGTVQISGLFDQ